MTSLKKQAIKSVKWTALQTVTIGISGAILLLIKARFLSPVEFGHMAAIFIVIGIIDLFESFGISQAIIQRDKVNLEESSTLFFFNIFFSVVLAIFLYILAPLIATFFSMPSIGEYLRVACVLPLITGATLLFHAFLEKQLYFKQLSVIAISRNLMTLGTTTIFLVLGLGVLGIIYAQIIGAAFSAVSILYTTVRLRSAKIKFYFNPKKLIPFLRFGFFVSAKNLMTFATHRLDEILIGYLLAPEILGIYYFGKNMLDRLRHLVTASFGKVLFPLLSKLKQQPQKLNFAYQRISQYIALVAFPLFAGVAVTANLFVPVIFGAKWEDSTIVFQVFSVAMILMVLTANVSTALLYSVNKPDLVFYIDVATNSIYFISLFLFAAKGMLAVLIVYSCYVSYKTITLQYYANRQLTESCLGYLRGLVIPAASALIMVFAIIVFQLTVGSSLGRTLQLIGSVCIGGLVYIAIVGFFARDTLMQFKSAIIKGDITLQ